MAKLTQAQKDRRAKARDKFYRLHFEFVAKGDRAADKGLREAARDYYNKANEYAKEYRKAGGSKI